MNPARRVPSNLMMISFVLLAILGQEPPAEPLLRVKSDGFPAALAFFPEGDRLFSVTRTREEGEIARIWDLSTGKEALRIQGDPKNSFYYFTLSEDGTTVAAIRSTVFVRAWLASSGEQISEFLPGGTTAHLVLSPNGKVVTCLHRLDGKFFLYDLATGKTLRQFDHGVAPQELAFSPDGKLIASSGGDGTLRLWNVETGQSLRIIQTHDRFADLQALFSRDGELVVTRGRENHAVQCFRVSNGQEVPLFPKDLWRVRAVAFSPDGRLVGCATEENSVRVLELASGKEVLRWDVGASEMAFSRSSGHLALATREELRVWKLVPDTAAEPPPEELETLWGRLALEVGGTAYRAVLRLAAGGRPAAAYLRKRLFESPLSSEQMKILIAELSHDDVAVREKALRALEEGAHDPALWKALESSPSEEVKARAKMLVEDQKRTPPVLPSLLGRCRAIWSLELMGAVELLEELSKGPEAARQTVEAKAALERLRKLKN
jgi:hypothetical protein